MPTRCSSTAFRTLWINKYDDEHDYLHHLSWSGRMDDSDMRMFYMVPKITLAQLKISRNVAWLAGWLAGFTQQQAE